MIDAISTRLDGCKNLERIEVARRIAEGLAGPVETIERMPYGHACETFSASIGSTLWTIKTSLEAGAFDYTASHFQMLASLDVPVPSGVTVGCLNDVHFLAYQALPGRDLGHELPTMSRPQMSALAERIVRIQRSVTQLPRGRGYGWTPVEVPGPFSTWLEVVERDSRSAPDEVKARIQECSGYFATLPATCFLDDITVKNVIVRDGELQGIVDLDFLCYGDPMYWLSLTETTVVLDVGFEAMFYCEELRRFWGLTTEEEHAAAIYRAMHATQFLRRSDLTPACRARMERFYFDLGAV